MKLGEKEWDTFQTDNMEELIKHRLGTNYDGCVKIASQLLETSGHVPIVTNVSMGAGYCSYYARLTEFIGVKSWLNFTVDRFSGKGRKAHELMGLACVEVFPNSQTIPTSDEILERIASEQVLVFKDDDEKKETLILAKALMHSLLNNLDSFCEIIGTDRKRLFPIAEQQFIDYRIHMRGIPDLILEDYEKGKAIVIDWKTGPRAGSNPIRIYNNEYAQVVAYSLMEAQRLKKTSLRDSITAKDGHVDILSVIIRSQDVKPESPNPILTGDVGQKSADQYMKIISNVLLEAEFLTILLANAHADKASKSALSLCEMKVDWSSKPQSMLTLMPNQFYRGKPKEQQKYPCVFPGGKFKCIVIEPCKFYYGRKFGSKEDYESDMWQLRYNTLNKKEDSLRAYRAIYDTFMYYSLPKEGSSAIEWFLKGKGFRHNKRGGVPRSIDRPQIVDEESGTVISRIDIVDTKEPDDALNDFSLKLSRPIRSWEDKAYYLIPMGKTVLLSLMDSWSPFLSISLFGNVRDVLQENGRILYEISVPSKIFRYQMHLFKQYLNKFETDRKILMVEVGADLTQVELSAVDALQELLDPENLKAQGYGKEEIQEFNKEAKIASSDEDENDYDENAQVLMDVFKNLAQKSSRRRDSV